ncbi:hypothetical protein [Parasitella parasitica]|uniref:F-box domain-containing protein n=1 Tax=Parasitella parasitica TaxID=35722 RepID=A0A0B7MPV1_9FUNG|nr:hypothetical protein [Parasitella parasitica]
MIVNLPEELLIKILDYNNSTQDLANYRLVCSCWNRLAEPLLFAKQITIKSEAGALSLFGHLYRNPDNGKIIKHLEFGRSYISTVILKELLRLAFTPNMEYLTGSIGSDELYMLMNNIADKTPDKFTRLKAIPSPEFFSNMYNSSLLTFKETLQDITFILEDDDDDESDHWDIINQLETFKNLTKLKLDGRFPALFDVENVLKGCIYLTELIMSTKFLDIIHPKSEMEAWTPTNVKIVENVKKVTITLECRSDLLEYLTFKYPKIEAINIDASLPIALARNNLLRTLNVIKKARSINVKFPVKEGDLADTLKYLIADGTRFIVKDTADNNFGIVITETL